jgi:macrolide transport system ATP-binding/permease protein
MNEAVFRTGQTQAAVPLISMQKVWKSYFSGEDVRVDALRGISLDIYPGEFVAIMGQSGSGKSTLMNLIGCLDRPTEGVYRFAGHNVSELDADALAWLRREGFGFVFQSYNLLAGATAEENVEIPAIYAGLSQQERRARAAQLLTSLGLGERLTHRPSQLSGGQQQRVSIARALMNGGKIILADEPTGALDTRSGAEVMALLKDLAFRGHTVILITHDPNVAANANRIIEFRDGAIVRDETKPGVQAINANALDINFSPETGESTATMIAGMNESLRMAMRALRTNMFRTLLTLLGIVIGVGSVVSMLAIGEGSRQSVMDRISSLGTNLLTVMPVFNGGAGQRGGSASTMTLEDADKIVTDVPNVSYVLPTIQGSATVRYGNLDYQTTITASGENMSVVKSWPLAEGTFFTREDSDTYTPVAVLGQTVVDNLAPGGGESLIGKYILIKNVPFQVIGILTSKGSNGVGQDEDDAVFVPLKTGGLRLFGQTYLRNITVAVKDVDKIDNTEEDVREFLLGRHGTEDFRIRNSASFLQTATATQDTLTLLLASVAAISLLVGGIGIMNIMLVSVTERTREIGIRMATGARQRDIMQQFLSEAVAVSAIGGVLGVVGGVAAGLIMQAFGTAIKFTPWPMLLAFCCAAATGLVFGFMPARKAAQLDPVVALAND